MATIARQAFLLSVAGLWMAHTPVTLAAASDPPDRCVDPPAAADTPDTGRPRLPDLRYECLTLESGSALWVGEGGNPEAPAVLLIHGLGQQAHRDWRSVVPTLLPGFRVITIDLPGFGASASLPGGYSFDVLAATLDEVLRRRQVEQAHVVGHSLGGALSLHLAWTHPQRVDRLVLVDAAGILQEAVYVRHLTQLDTSPGSGSRPASVLKRGVNFLRLNLLRKADGKINMAWLTRNPRIRNALLGDRPGMDAAISLVLQNFTTAIRDTTAPTTLIWGRDDPIAPLRTGWLLAARMPSAQLHVLDKVGHVPMTEAPVEFAGLLTDALTAPPAPPPTPALIGDSQGDVVCKSKARMRYTGHFNSLRLINCADAQIEDATLGRLLIDESTAELRNVTVNSDTTALTVLGSIVTGTGVWLQGPITLRADGSELDLAGATLKATGKAFHISSSARIYFSVSDIESPDYSGTAHEIWTPATLQKKARQK